jgi:hypothetical protein
MHPKFKKLQDEYIDALRPAIGDALRWWEAHCSYPHTEPRSYAEMEPFHRRWMSGPASHPRVIAVFRDFYFQVQALNDAADAAEAADAEATDKRTGAPEEERWGSDVPPAWVPRAHPLDVLINDLATIAPDLHEAMQGFLYVPIGMDPQQVEC